MKIRSIVFSISVASIFVLLAGILMMRSTPTVAQQAYSLQGCLEVSHQIYLPQVGVDTVMTPSATVTPATPIPTCVPVLPPTLVSPVDGSLLAKTTFDWSDVSGAAEYVIELSETMAFTDTVWVQTVNQSEYEYISDLNGTYYWRVAVTGSGVSPYSEVWEVVLVDYNGDADGDELPNGWELHGYDYGDDGTIDVDLPALGANYDHKDIFVEMDYMIRPSAGNGLGPNQNVIDEIVAVFADAPVSNPDGVDGINIHLELDEEVPHDSDLNPVTSQFLALKDTYFQPEDEAVYFYMIWGDRYNGGSSSGYAFNIPNSYFLVTLGAWNSNEGGDDDQKIGTFIHELGHDLGLTHGGSDHENYKPNYLSVMNYFFQVTGVYRDASWGHFDYQRFPTSSLNESSLNETLGLNGGTELTGYATRHYCPNGSFTAVLADVPIDWNCNLNATETSVTVNINNSSAPYPVISTLTAQDNWANIVFNGGGVIGSGSSAAELGSREQVPDEAIQELTYEMYQEMQDSFEGDLVPDSWTNSEDH